MQAIEQVNFMNNQSLENSFDLFETTLKIQLLPI
jgi:hypothetical protein